MIKAIIFDLNGTLIDILTDEWSSGVYRTVSAFLAYYGIYIRQEELQERYLALNREQRRRSIEEFPEFDAVRIFRDIILEKKPMDETTSGQLAVSAARVYRAASLRKLELYPGVLEILAGLKKQFKLAALSDGQSAWAVPELNMAGLQEFFPKITLSGDLGFRKPDRRMFELTLKQLGTEPNETIFVGNDMYRDIYGGHEAGLKTVFFRSNQGDWDCRMAEPDYIIYSFYELPDAVDFLCAK